MQAKGPGFEPRSLHEFCFLCVLLFLYSTAYLPAIHATLLLLLTPTTARAGLGWAGLGWAGLAPSLLPPINCRSHRSPARIPAQIQVHARYACCLARPDAREQPDRAAAGRRASKAVMAAFNPKSDHNGIRTHNLSLRRRTPYPLGHAALLLGPSNPYIVLLARCTSVLSDGARGCVWLSHSHASSSCAPSRL